MSVFVLDTDTLSLFAQDHPRVVARVLASLPGQTAITVIQVEEVIAGWFTTIRRAKSPAQQSVAYQALIDSFTLLSHWHVLTFNEAAIARFETLRRMKLNVGANDLRIASIVLEHNATLVTRNIRDFSRVPNLLYTNWAE